MAILRLNPITGNFDLVGAGGGGGGGEVRNLIATVESIDATTTGLTNLYTVPAGKELVITNINIRTTAFTEGSKTTQATAHIGKTDPDYKDFYDASNFWYERFSAIDQVFVIVPNYNLATGGIGGIPIYQATEVIKLNIATASDADVEEWAVDIWGYFIGETGVIGTPGPAGEPGASTWGDLTGTLSDQTDLQTALDDKVDNDGDVMTGDYRINGYVRVGSTSAPSNTTAGDLTATRFSLNNQTLSAGNGSVIAASGTVTDTSGTSRIYSFQPTITPASNSSATFQALHFLGIWNPATGVTQTAIRGFDSGLRIRGDGLVGTVIGYEVAAFQVDSSSLSTAQATNVYGIEAVLYNRPSGTTTTTFNTGIAFRADLGASLGLTATTITGFAVVNPGANTITTLIGMDIPALTRGATNIGVRIGLPSGGATANYALQLSDTGGTAAGGITFGTDVQLYRSAANVLNLASGDSLTITAANLITDTTTGIKIGTGTTQKIAFYNSTPIVQPSGTGETTGFTAGAGTNVTDASTFTGNVGSTAYRVSDIVKALKNLGLLAS